MPKHQPRESLLVGRAQEIRTLDGLLDDARAGHSGALVVHGEPGIGKTALLDYVIQEAADLRLVTVAGVQSEMELSFGALHQLVGPFLDHLELLPQPQRDALEITFGISTGAVPDRLLVSLAVLSLFSEAAVERPIVCVVDDAQWLDRASAGVIAFLARRLGTESVAVVIGCRHVDEQFLGLPELALSGLSNDAARSLLSSVQIGPIDPRVVDRFLAETGGNPLAVLELPRGLTAAELSAGFAAPVATLPFNVEASFRRRIEALPEDTQRLVQLAAADPLGDPLLLWRSADLLAIPPSAARPAVDDGLISFDARVRFRHPLVRSAAYQWAPPETKRQAHAALAQATDPGIDPERRTWHRAQAAVGPDEEVAAELVRYADRAQARGGRAAAAEFLERATTLSDDPEKRAQRALAAGAAKLQAGAYPAALELLSVAEAGPLGVLDQAKVGLVRAQLAFASDRFSTDHRNAGAPLLLGAAQQLEALDVGLSRATYLNAMMAAMLAGQLGGAETDVTVVARAARSAPVSEEPNLGDLLLDGLATTYSAGYAEGEPLVRTALSADTAQMPGDQELRWLSLAYRAAVHYWDDTTAMTLSARAIQRARELGALSELALAINDRALFLFLTGEPTRAASAVEEARATAEAVGGGIVPYGPMGVAAFRGDDARAMDLIDAWRVNSQQRGEGAGVAGADWAEAVLNNGLGRHRQAFEAANRSFAPANLSVVGLANWILFELIESAARTGHPAEEIEALRQLTEMAAVTGTDWVLGVDALARALFTEDDEAEKLYREATDRLALTGVKTQLARAHLLFGEWLRRRRRRAEARAELRVALDMLEAMQMEAFAERARRELNATGQTARKRAVDNSRDLTAQESQIAKLAREGLSNPEIAARLYLSARTVQYHLSKVFAKLDITSRSQLDRVSI